jgi:hypothetical protein
METNDHETTKKEERKKQHIVSRCAPGVDRSAIDRTVAIRRVWRAAPGAMRSRQARPYES